MPTRYSRSDALKILKQHLNDGKILPSRHFKERLLERKLSMQDVVCAIKKGRITEEPELDIKIGNWKYRVRGKTIDEDPVIIVAAINEDHSIYLTAIRGD